MPELPEVEAIVRFLNKKITNLKITDIIINKQKLLKNKTPKQFQQALISQEFYNVDRTGKFLIFNLSNDLKMVVHLRMEGKFFYVETDNEIINNKHSHIIFKLNNSHCLVYNDTRIFGTFHLFDKLEILTYEGLTKLGIEPIQDEFSFEYLKKICHGSNKKIKTFLLDQTKILGIGNIYADEILFASYIHPLSVTSKIPNNRLKLIHKYSKSILTKAIENNGTTVHSFKFNGIESGSYQQFLQVYGKATKNCSNCSQKLVKIKVNGRGTTFCKHCQKKYLA